MTVIRLSSYRDSFLKVKDVLIRDVEDGKDLAEIAGKIANMTSIPLVAVYSFMKEMIGREEEINRKIDSLTKFYDYKAIEE